jgi:hypothetical protein
MTRIFVLKVAAALAIGANKVAAKIAAEGQARGLKPDRQIHCTPAARHGGSGNSRSPHQILDARHGRKNPPSSGPGRRGP